MILRMNMQANTLIPLAVLDAYFDTQPGTIRELKGGIINQTYLIVDHRSRSLILQQLNPLFNEQTVQDFSIVSKHLVQASWPVQEVVLTRQGDAAFRDTSGGLWRLLSYIEGIDAPEIMTEQQLFEVGALLAKLHSDLQRVDYEPTFAIPNFHNTKFYHASLQSVRDKLATEDLRQLADNCLRAFETIEQPPALRKQLIHGDPRTTNIIFKKSLPIAYIDFDTLMFDSPWIDIGDILRSINGSNDQTIERVSRSNTQALIRGYYSRNSFGLSFDEFLYGALVSMQIICIELAMRFTTDVVHDNYFGWDPNLFESRSENNVARAEAQWNIYKKACEIINEG